MDFWGRAENMRQLHFHIEDPTFVSLYKSKEQRSRDSRNEKKIDNYDGDWSTKAIASWGMRFRMDLSFLGLHFYQIEDSKDEMAALNSFCDTVASFELLVETKHLHSCSVYFQGVQFALPPLLKAVHLKSTILVDMEHVVRLVRWRNV